MDSEIREEMIRFDSIRRGMISPLGEKARFSPDNLNRDSHDFKDLNNLGESKSIRI